MFETTEGYSWTLNALKSAQAERCGWCFTGELEFRTTEPHGKVSEWFSSNLLASTFLPHSLQLTSNHQSHPLMRGREVVVVPPSRIYFCESSINQSYGLFNLPIFQFCFRWILHCPSILRTRTCPNPFPLNYKRLITGWATLVLQIIMPWSWAPPSRRQGSITCVQ